MSKQTKLKTVLLAMTVFSMYSTYCHAGSMMSSKKSHHDSSGIETLLVAGMLAKMLSNSQSKTQPQQTYVAYPVMSMGMHHATGGHQSMGGHYGMGGHAMGGHYSMGGHGTGGHYSMGGHGSDGHYSMGGHGTGGHGYR